MSYRVIRQLHQMGILSVSKNGIPGRASMPQLGELGWALELSPVVLPPGILKLPGLKYRLGL